MVRNYKKKTKRNKWADGQMQLALDSVQNGKSIKSAALEFGVPRSTLQLHILKSQEDKLQKKDAIKGGSFKPIFTSEQEEVLAKYINDMESRLIGLSPIDVRRLAYQFAEKLKIEHTFNTDKGLAGIDWLHGFLKRNHLSDRKAEHTSSARANGFNKESVSEFFVLLKDVLEKYNFTPDNIYNVDETGVSVVPKTSPRIIARKGKRQVGGKTVAERGETVTAQICMSASGKFMPPMLIFPRVKENLQLLKGAPPGASALFHKSGYMQMELMTKWVEKFVQFSHASVENPVLLLLDGHVTHVRNLQFIEVCQSNGVIALCFPPHCTHKLQPLDVGFMGPLNGYFGKEVAAMQQQNLSVNLKNLFSVFGKAFLQAAKMDTAVNSFRKCGIYPFNPNVFSDADFAAAKRESNIVTSPSDTTNQVCTVKATELTQVIQTIRSSVPNENSTSQTCKGSSQTPIQNKDSSDFVNTHNEDSVNIPASEVLQAVEPLLKLLKPYLESSLENKSTRLSSNDVHVNVLTESETQEVSKTAPSSTNQGTSAKKARAKGKAAIVTEDHYKENLIAEKIRTMKKEDAQKISEVTPGPSPAKSTTRKRKVTPANKNQAKIPKVMKLSNAVPQVTNPLPQEPLRILSTNVPVIPQQPLTIFSHNNMPHKTALNIFSNNVPIQTGHYVVQSNGNLLSINNTNQHMCYVNDNSYNL